MERTWPHLGARSRHRQRPQLSQRDALALQHLPLADALARAFARRFHPLLEQDDLIQIAREALLRAAARCKADYPPEPYLRRCIQGALQHHLRDGVRLVRVPRRAHERGGWPFRHASLDAMHAREEPLLKHLGEQTNSPPRLDPACWQELQQRLDQLPAHQAAALRLTVLDGRSLRQAAQQLGISFSSVGRHRRQAIETLQQQWVA